MDYFKRFFGFSSKDSVPPEFFERFDDFPSQREEENPFKSRNFQGPKSFCVFSDPLEMHQYFEQQMNEMLKSFGFGFQIFDNPEGFFNQFSNPSIESGTQFPEISETETHDLREQFLKKGYEKPSQYLSKTEKKDKDLDDRIKHGDLNSILDGHDSKHRNIMPHNYGPHTFFSGQSVSIKTITNPDGSIETHRTVKDDKGNEEITVCRRIGDKEHCVIKKRDKMGKEEVTENFVNMNEEDNFLKPKYDNPHTSDPTSSLFDKFFK